jgi:hypothetical protein
MRRLACVLALALVAPTARADLAFTNCVVDVGEVRSGIALKQAFAFVNDGPGEARITDLQTGCGCLKPRLGKRTYVPGERGEVVLEVHTLSQPAGDHTWRLHVAYQVGCEPRTAELLLKGRVVTEVVVRPAALTIFTGGSAAHEVTLTDLRARPLSVTGVHASSPHLTGDVQRTAEDEAGHRVITIALSLAADCPEGRSEQTLVLLTDDAEYRELTIPVTVVKRPKQGVTAAPAAVSLAAPPGQPVPSRIVLLRPVGATAVVVESIEADDPAVVCTWARGPGECATLKVAVDRARLPADGLHSAIHVRLSGAVNETITVPVTCIVQ